MSHGLYCKDVCLLTFAYKICNLHIRMVLTYICIVISSIFTEIMISIEDSFNVLSLPKIGQLGPITNEEINPNLYSSKTNNQIKIICAGMLILR